MIYFGPKSGLVGRTAFDQIIARLNALVNAGCLTERQALLSLHTVSEASNFTALELHHYNYVQGQY